MTPRRIVLVGEAASQLRRLAPKSVDCVVTSPPYFLLRDYRVTGSLGMETTVEEWVRRLRTVMAEIARVLVPTGSVWLNLGDGYARNPRQGAPRKSLILAPERLALALIEDGWIVRNRITWAKTNPMPQSVADRLSTTSDVVFFLTRSPHYHFDLDAIRLPYTGKRAGLPADATEALAGSNPGDVWRLPIAHYRGAHTSTFPPGLVRTPLLATCPQSVCLRCGASWKTSAGRTYVLGQRLTPPETDRLVRRHPTRWRVARQPGPVGPTCDCEGPTRPGLVLDPFFGTGTTGVVAEELGRDWLGIELDPETARLAWDRLGRDPTAGELAA